jgi:Flp pilus assembly protein protease CpaA
VLAKFLLTAGLDARLFLGVALYFTAGVFKVKTLLLRKTQDRILGALYVMLSAYVYRRMHIPLIVLLPLIDNLIVAAWPYKVKLKTTGWIEVAKGLAFLGLFGFYY